MAESRATSTRRTVLVQIGAAATGGVLVPTQPAAAEAPAAQPNTALVSVEDDVDMQVANGKAITIGYDEHICIHARFCVLWRPSVFIAGGNPWIAPDSDSAETTVSVINSCPSGALQYIRHDGGSAEQEPPINIAYVRENGPYAFRAKMTLNGKPIGYRATMCRCGKSKNKPLCDRSHLATKFEASGEMKTIDSPNLVTRNGELSMIPLKDGPLKVVGNLEICSGTARTIKRTTVEILCRCGHSQTKPFCDGSHRAAGFKAEGEG